MARYQCIHLCAVALAVLVTAGTPVTAGPTMLPPEFKRCKRDGNLVPCLEDALVGALQKLATGLPEFNIPAMEPLKVPLLEIGDAKTDAPVNLHMKLMDVNFHNVKTARPVETKVDLDNYMIYTRGKIPIITGDADYEMDGRILVIPAKGSGRMAFNITGVEVEVGVKGVKNMKKGREYMKVVDFTCTFLHIDKMELHFENLFNGDEALGKTINDLINENWQELYLQLKDPVEQGFKYTFQEFARRIFDKVAMDDIFLRE